MNQDAVKNYLLHLLVRHLAPTALAWLQRQMEHLQSGKEYYLAFSMAPRFTGKHPLELSEEDLQAADQVRPGFNPQGWTQDQAARALFTLSVPHESPEAFVSMLNKVFSTADLNELTALYAALPLLPYPELHVKRAAEGVRTTMTQVFDAIALDNPYPHDYLPEDAWNQLVLKSVFNVRPLHRIYGLDARRNPHLAEMLLDYAHERWAAGRTLTPELWRMVGPYLTPATLPDIERLFSSPEPVQHQAAALTLTESDLPEAKALLARYPDLQAQAQTGSITWDQIGQQAYA